MPWENPIDKSGNLLMAKIDLDLILVSA